MLRDRLIVLDGVRGVSIVLVLAAHLLPIYFFGIKLNESLGMLGMSLFFGLSGYLITKQIVAGVALRDFILRRCSRIVPAAWLCLGITFIFTDPDPWVSLRNYLFVANLPPQALVAPLEHFWSLNLEMQFYLLSAILIVINRGLVWSLFPVFLVLVIANRIVDGVAASSFSLYRVDDLLAGACAALISLHPRTSELAKRIGFGEWKASVLCLILLIASTMLVREQFVNHLSYFRSVFLMGLLVSLILGQCAQLTGFLSSPPLLYIASVSYAIYLWHMPLGATWLGSGDVVEKYLKRPVLFACILLIAHISTFTIEKFFSNVAVKYLRKH